MKLVINNSSIKHFKHQRCEDQLCTFLITHFKLSQTSASGRSDRCMENRSKMLYVPSSSSKMCEASFVSHKSSIGLSNNNNHKIICTLYLYISNCSPIGEIVAWNAYSQISRGTFRNQYHDCFSSTRVALCFYHTTYLTQYKVAHTCFTFNFTFRNDSYNFLNFYCLSLKLLFSGVAFLCHRGCVYCVSI